MKRLKKLDQRGLLLVEIVLAVAVFGMIALIVVSAFVYGRESTVVAGDNSRGGEVANQAIEAVHNIAQNGYSNLASYTNGTTYYLSSASGQWTLSTTPTTINNLYTPAVVFSAGPTANSRQVTVTVSWKENAQRNGQIVASTYLSNWQSATSGGGTNNSIKSGLLVYANGGTTTNLIDYRLLQSNGLWTSPAALPTAGSSNRVPRSVKLYPAQSGNTKMVVTRLYDGTNQYLYAYLWTGTAWNTPQLLASWRSSASLDSGNFSGTWLTNGTFVVAYSDNTNKPKYNTYNGSAWSAQGTIGTISSNTTDTPTSLILQARPGTNEAMVAMLGQDYETLTAYFASNAWSAFTTQATNAATDGSHLVDFYWSPVTTTQGALMYSRGSSDRTPSFRIFTANGTGGGSWGSVLTGTNQPTGSIIESFALTSQAGSATAWQGCDKDSQSQQHIYCYTVTTSGVTSPTNSPIATNSASGGQQTVELGFEQQIGTTGLAAYSDATTSGKVKRFTAGTNTWDANPISEPSTAANIYKTRLIPEPGLNDAMVLSIDSQNNLYSNMFNGTTGAFYTTPTGYAWTIHNANGPSVDAKWFDFAWDNQ